MADQLPGPVIAPSPASGETLRTHVRANGVELYVIAHRDRSDAGGRPVLVLVHGLTVNHAGLGLTLGIPLASSADVILYDLRGHGRSQIVPSGYQVADHVADLFALLGALDVTGPVHLLAWSYGGAVAAAAALADPDRIATLTLVEGLVPHPCLQAFAVPTLERAREALSRDYTVEDVMEVLGIGSRRRAAARAGYVEKLIMHTTLLEDVRREPVLNDEDFSRLRCPVLGIYGDVSPIYPIADLLRGRVPQSEVHTIPGAGHFDVFRHTREIERLVRGLVGLPDVSATEQ